MADDITSKTDEEILQLVATLKDYPSGIKLAIEAELNRRGIASRVHGAADQEWGLAESAALAAIQMIRGTDTAVLRITPYDRESGQMSAGDSWVSDRNWGESERYYASRSQREATTYITSYARPKVLFVLTLKNPTGAVLGPFAQSAPADSISIFLMEKIGYLILAFALALPLAMPYPQAYPLAFAVAWLFPIGLVVWLSRLGISLSEGAALVLGYATYAVLAVVALTARERKNFFRVFWIICGFLAANVAGCHWILNNIHD